MANDKIIGGAVFGGSVIGIILYAILLLYAWGITVRVTAFVGVALILAILAWIGFTMASTPPPEPITEIPEAGTPSGEAKDETKTKGQ